MRFLLLASDAAKVLVPVAVQLALLSRAAALNGTRLYSFHNPTHDALLGPPEAAAGVGSNVTVGAEVHVTFSVRLDPEVDVVAIGFAGVTGHNPPVRSAADVTTPPPLAVTVKVGSTVQTPSASVATSPVV